MNLQRSFQEPYENLKKDLSASNEEPYQFLKEGLEDELIGAFLHRCTFILTFDQLIPFRICVVLAQ